MSTARALFVLLCLAAGSLNAAEDAALIDSDGDDRNGLALTLYQNGATLVEDRRSIALQSGVTTLLMEDVSPLLLPQSLRLEAGDGVRTLSHRLQLPSLDAGSLADAYLGEDVMLVRDLAGGGQRSRPVRLLARDGDTLIIRDGDGVEPIPASSGWRLRVPGLPPESRGRTALLLEVESATAGSRDGRLLYLTEGLGWQADYVLSIDGDQLSVKALAGIDNRTGLAFPDAHVRLVAGDPARSAGPVARSMTLEDASVADVGVGDYRLYELPEPVTLGRSEQVHLPLFQVANIPAQREYRLVGNAWGPQRTGPVAQPVMARLRLDTGPDGIARAMPAGTARVYETDPRYGAIFLGEDRVPATAEGGHAELSLGMAFDLSATRQQTRYRRLDERSEEQGWQIRVRNTRDRDASIRIIEQMPGDWTLLESSQDPDRSEPGRAIWTLNVPAGGEAQLRYLAEVRR
ncbi:hypothetical protein J2T57_002335 [Natronocella acetinitrilica]|uniref:DUF4139 domain-containing protein n=1 Tax=Natronocella acetinitrilica TaxID=414046 RepID=A0AAE3KGF3_9GAMM|nr:DUF4139 domain-containing protein [Natronocella acetinitrilica]MCP1675187.1 hypothetical protein [Natronocella acetinitrilica]